MPRVFSDDDDSAHTTDDGSGLGDVRDVKVGTMLGRFRLDERIGAGGMGIVYKGVDIESNAPVAVKFLHEAFAGIADFVKRFQREVQAMRKISAHPHLVAILDAGVSGGVPYLVMELLAGRSLAEVLDAGAVDPARAVHIVQQLLDGVGHAHGSGVVHRDLKPDNVLLTDGDGVKILDFGLAKMAQEGATQLTTTGLALGTPGYMSPEQARGSPADERADIYSVGVILYHLVVGKKPFVADSAMAVMRMHMEELPVSPRIAVAALEPSRRLSSALDAAILRALEKDPAKRWPTAAAFAAALAAAPEGGGSLDDLAFEKTAIGRKAASPSPAPSPPDDSSSALSAAADASRVAAPEPRRRGRSWPGTVVLLALVAGGVYGWTVYRSSKRVQQKVSRQIDSAVSSAKKAMESLTAPAVNTAVNTDDSKAAADPKATATPDTSDKVGPVDKLGSLDTSRPAVKPADAVVNDGTDDVDGETDDKADSDDKDDAPKQTPGAQLEAQTKAPAPSKLTLSDATRLLTTNKVDEAMQALYQLRQRTPRSPAIALFLGHAYFRKSWRHDGLREYTQALTLSPSLKRNVTVIHNAVEALADPTYRSARIFLRNRIGTLALAELRRAGKSDDDVIIRRRAAKLAAQMTPAPKKRHRR